MLQLDSATTALVLIDLQHGIVTQTLHPRPGSEVVHGAQLLATRFRQAKAPVVLVHVAFAPDGGDALKQPVDKARPKPPGGYPENWSQLVDGLAHPGDIHVTKHQWGAFYGTDLDVQLRRRGISTIVLGGIATNMGVESTARQAYEHGYAVLLAEDLTTSLGVEMHEFPVRHIFPMISRVVESKDLELTPGSAGP